MNQLIILINNKNHNMMKIRIRFNSPLRLASIEIPAIIVLNYGKPNDGALLSPITPISPNNIGVRRGDKLGHLPFPGFSKYVLN